MTLWPASGARDQRLSPCTLTARLTTVSTHLCQGHLQSAQ